MELSWGVSPEIVHKRVVVPGYSGDLLSPSVLGDLFQGRQAGALVCYISFLRRFPNVAQQ